MYSTVFALQYKEKKGQAGLPIWVWGMDPVGEEDLALGDAPAMTHWKCHRPLPSLCTGYVDMSEHIAYLDLITF